MALIILAFRRALYPFFLSLVSMSMWWCKTTYNWPIYYHRLIPAVCRAPLNKTYLYACSRTNTLRSRKLRHCRDRRLYVDFVYVHAHTPHLNAQSTSKIVLPWLMCTRSEYELHGLQVNIYLPDLRALKNIVERMKNIRFVSSNPRFGLCV